MSVLPAPTGDTNGYLNEYDNLASDAGIYAYDPIAKSHPPTPSYNGSYNNSPYTSYSDLSYDPADDHTAPFDTATAGLGLFDPRDPADSYNPIEYDAPHAGGLLMFAPDMMRNMSFDPSNPHVNLGLTTPPNTGHDSAFDHSSPSSVGSGDAVRSRASSLSSVQHTSPRMGVINSFEALSFERQSLSPPQKPSSPPQLLIPDTSPAASSFPVINAPEGEGGMMGPSLNIVPATPVDGGASAANASSDGLRSDPSASSDWSTTPRPSHNASEDQPMTFTFPPTSDSAPSGSNLTLNTDPSGNSPYLVPVSPRVRSKSDTSGGPQSMWNFPPAQRAQYQESALDDTFASPYDPFTMQNPAHIHGQPGLPHHVSYGPGITTNGPGNWLDIPGTQIRRASSYGGHRQVRSMGDAPGLLSPGMARQTLSMGGERLPSIRHGRRPSADRGISAAYLEPQFSGGLGSRRQSPYPSPHASPRGGYEALPPEPGFGMDGVASISGRRASLGGAGMDMGGMRLVGPQDYDLMPGMGYSSPQMQHNMGGSPGVGGVSKVNVTTHATKDASEKRRKVDATFMCPVPGCGSTFTRHFNLKGHMRSHNEEKPFKCKWPGCQKSFARQHDCKRHENLHLNIRPFTCEGCHKTFARMDALNRHLRSEGGAECQSTQKELTSADVAAGFPDAEGARMKAEPDVGWGAGGLMM